MKKLLQAAALTALVAFGIGGSTTSYAATCPDNDTLDRTISLDVSAGCWAYGEGNINGNPAKDPILNQATTDGNTFVQGGAYVSIADLILLDKSDEAGGAADGVLGGALSGQTSGTITVGPVSGFTSFILAIKTGNNKNPSWAAFLISGAGSYLFGIIKPQGISHANLYGVESDDPGPGEIPLPGGIILLLTGLAGLGGLARMRKAADKA